MDNPVPFPFCEIITEVDDDDDALQPIDSCHNRAEFRIMAELSMNTYDQPRHVCSQHLSESLSRDLQVAYYVVNLAEEQNERWTLGALRIKTSTEWTNDEEPF